MTTDTISVPEVHCGHCVSSIEGALRPMEGVSEASVDLESRSVSVTWDEAVLDRQALVDAIEEQGYEVPAQD